MRSRSSERQPSECADGGVAAKATRCWKTHTAAEASRSRSRRSGRFCAAYDARRWPAFSAIDTRRSPRAVHTHSSATGPRRCLRCGSSVVPWQIARLAEPGSPRCQAIAVARQARGVPPPNFRSGGATRRLRRAQKTDASRGRGGRNALSRFGYDDLVDPVRGDAGACAHAARRRHRALRRASAGHDR